MGSAEPLFVNLKSNTMKNTLQIYNEIVTNTRVLVVNSNYLKFIYVESFVFNIY